MKGIDVSFYQKGMDLSRVKEENDIDFVIIRLGYGPTIVDDYIPFYDAAIAAGIPVGAYFYSLAVTEEEAIRDAKRALLIAGGRQFPLGIYMDVESGSQLALRDSVLTAVVKAFCDTIRSAGYRPGAYGSALNLWAKVGPSYLGDDVLVWTAWWNKSNPPKPCDIWQTSETGWIQGIQVDTDVSFSERFEALVRGEAPEPQPQPEPDPEPSEDPFCIHDIPVIRYGDFDKTGEFVVKALQGELMARGYPCGGKKNQRGVEEPDGIFGNITQEAVRSFQRSKNLPDTGVADYKTRKALLGV